MSDDRLLDLLVTRSEPAADGIQLFELRDPDGRPLPAFTAGSHIAVRVPSGAMRTYSLCSDPTDASHYRIAVKRDEQGRGGSRSLVDGVHTGDRLSVSTPRNLFGLVPAPSYIFVAGGIGITPIQSMIHALRADPAVKFKLYYLTRNAPGTAFLDALSNDARATIHHDGGQPDNAFDLWPVFEEPTKAHIYCCGPRPLMDAVRDMTGHWPASQVHFEDFGSDLVRPRANDTPFTIRLAHTGGELSVPVGVTILEVLRSHGLKLPSSCESGTCGTCRTGLLSGDVDHRDLVLTPAEQTREIMICISRAHTGDLVLAL